MYNEQLTIELINTRYGTCLKLVKDKFCSYDAIDNNYILEIKNRRAYYETKVIEASKLFTNFQKSQLLNKTFLYCVTDSKGVYILSVNRHINKIINRGLTSINSPASTDFSDTRKIKKYCYTLIEDWAVISNK